MARAPRPPRSPSAWTRSLKVTLFTEFPDIAYSPCGIPFVHGREIDKFESLFLSTVERYVEDGLDMRMETTVTDIDLARGTVTSRNTHEGFDKLVDLHRLDVGEADVPGSNLDGLHYVKDIRAAMEFDKELDSMKRIVVYGGTPIGVEMAGNLAHRGLQVEFVDEGPWALSELLDPDVAEPVHESLTQARRDAALRHQVEAFIGDGGRVRAVQTSAGELECDAVIVCLHKVPSAELAAAAGLKIGTTGAIMVDERMRTSKPTASGRRATWSRSRTGSRCCRSAGSPARTPTRRAARRRSTSPARTSSTTRSGSRGGWSPATTRSAASRSARRSPPRWASRTSWPRASASPAPATSRAPPAPTSSCSPSRTRYKIIGAQIHGGEGVKERADFLAFAAKRGATLDDLAWMENIYSPPIGALFEPVAIAAQNGLAALREKAAAA